MPPLLGWKQSESRGPQRDLCFLVKPTFKESKSRHSSSELPGTFRAFLGSFGYADDFWLQNVLVTDPNSDLNGKEERLPTH